MRKQEELTGEERKSAAGGGTMGGRTEVGYSEERQMEEGMYGSRVRTHL